MLVAGSAGAQEIDGAPDPLPLRARTSLHLDAAIGLEAQAGLLLSSGLAHATRTPEAWERGARGFGRRYGHALGIGAAHEAIQIAAGHTLGQDPRYQRLGGGGLIRRTGHAVRAVVVSRGRDGRHRPAWPRFAGAFGAAAVSSTWYPESNGVPRHIAAHGVYVLGGDLLSTLWDEFRPDLLPRIGR